jgi:multidrug efflux system membrane fusion protein
MKMPAGHVIVGRSLVVTLVASTIVLTVFVLRRLDVRPRTTDAVVTANTIQVVPEVTGRIAILNVKDDDKVRKGDVLFEIERELYDLNLAQALAQVHALEAEIALGNRRVSSERSGVDVARANAEGARARLDEATRTLARLEPLLPERYVTPQQVDLARTSKATAESQLLGAQSATQQSSEAVGDTNALLAQLEGARALVGRAERDLRNTVVRASFDGRIVGVTTSLGQYVDPVRPLFTLIDTSQWYVVADFRETQLRRMRPGERARAYVMTSPKVRLQGVVESVGSAVAQPENLSIAGVPPVPRDLNWVRIAQRFPVRIALDHPPDELMRIGASAVAVVQHERN